MSFKNFLRIIAVILILAGCSEAKIQTGDLLFVGIPIDYSLDEASMDNAIASATGDENQINYIHAAILEVEDEQTWIIDATIKHGVDRHPLDTFLKDFTLKDGSLPVLDVRRVKNITPQQAQAAVEKAKTFVGKSYDSAFLPDNDDLYCTELVQNSYLDEDGRPIFLSKPMNFKDADGNMPIYWEQLFAILGMPVPQGVPGTNPQDMQASARLKKVCILSCEKAPEDCLELTWKPFTGELAHTFTIATYSRTTTPIVHTFISWKGYTGYGEAAMPQYLGETTESVCAFLELAKDQVLSKCSDPFQIEDILTKVDALAPRNTAAKASIDMALNDLVGKISGLPWWKMRGIDPAKAPLTSFTIGYDADDEVVREKVREASWAKILKVKLGISPDEDRRMIRLIREESDVPIYVDANQGWKTPQAALEMCQWLATQGVVLVEQPMAKELLSEHAWLKERSPLPIIADEACQRLSDIARIAPSYDGINIKLMKCTGLNEALKMVWTARALGLKVMVGCMTETSAGISAAAQISPLVDYADLDGNLLLKNDCYDGVKVIDGRLTLNDRPGIGAI